MSPKRIQMRRTKGWRKPEGVIVVARPLKWGNPFKVSDYVDDWPDCNAAQRRAMAVSDFRGFLEGRWEWGEAQFASYPQADIRTELRGHDLACWCPLDQPCHADVLLEWANR